MARPLRLPTALTLAPRAALAALLLLAFAPLLPAHAAEPAANAAAAEAYGLFVDFGAVRDNVPITLAPQAWAAQQAPPNAAAPAEAHVAAAGPLPADGSVVSHVGAMDSTASANTTPIATATAQTADVDLFDGFITADLVKSQSNSDCTKDPNGTGTTFTNLSVEGQPVEQTPAPNTVLDFQVIKFILNEQVPASDGRGFVVNAIHVISTSTGGDALHGEIIISHAMSTVNCLNGAGSTGAANPVQITKDVTPTNAKPGDQLTYTATFTNKATADCAVLAAIDHLPVGFELVSTAGDLGTTSTTRNRPGGGLDVIVGDGKTIAVNGSATQTFVVKVGADVASGVYYNNVELFCGNLGQFVKGLDAPVEVVAPRATAAGTSSPPAAPAPTVLGRTVELPATGGLPVPLLALAALLALGLAGFWATQSAAASTRDR